METFGNQCPVFSTSPNSSGCVTPKATAQPRADLNTLQQVLVVIN